MKILLLAAVLPLALTCCAGPGSPNAVTFDACQPLVVVLGPEITPDQRDAVTRAIAMWNALGVTRLTLDDAPGAARVPLHFEDAADNFHGVYEAQTGDVLINRRLTDPAAIAVVVAHELGHAMALVHVNKDERASVMNPDNLSEPPTPVDGAWLSAQWNHCAGAGPATP